MAYVEGFVIPVVTNDKNAFVENAQKVAGLMKEFGATRVADAWGDDVPDGKVNDFKGSVKAEDGETVCFGWMEYPDKATRDAASEKMMSDPRMQELGDMPFDGKRMIFGGFVPIVADGPGGKAGYVDGFLLAVPNENREAYRAMAARASAVFLDHGALRCMECWGDDVPDGKVTDYRRATHAKDGETVLFSWIEWPDKATRDTGMKATMEDDRLKEEQTMPFDGMRMIYGGFAMVSDR